MCLNAKSIVNFHYISGKSFFVSLLLMTMLVFSCFISVFSNGVSPFILGAPDRTVSNETELRDAVNNAPSKTSTIITLNNNISLSTTLIIPTNKDITLTSNNKNGFCTLFNGVIVESGGVLKIDGIIITNSSQSGVIVKENGCLSLYSGEISGNNAYGYMVGVAYAFILRGGGVYNNGTFEMFGGKIFGNIASFSASVEVNGEGGGVYNMGTFKMYGGEISNNFVVTNGGGVYNNGGIFTMSGGTISNNAASHLGGGVFNTGIFDRSGGTISDNRPTDVNDHGDGGHSSGGSSNGNNGVSSGNNSGGSSTNNGGSFNGTGSSGSNGGVTSNDDGFSLREVVIICIGVVGVTLAAVMAILLFTSKTKLGDRDEKQRRLYEYDVKLKINLRHIYSKCFLLFISLLFVVLVSSLFVCVMVNYSSGASLVNVVYVKNEEELRNAVTNASSMESIVIALDNDIVFTDFTRLRIPANSDVTLTSSKTTGYYKILRSITVESGGVLNVDGVIITNEPTGAGGVEVKKGGRLILYSGEISGNSLNGSLDPFVHAYGGGVCNYGVFEMYGGKISSNRALDGEGVGNIFAGNYVGHGGGVANYGTFKMFGGEISGNTARYGGGVYNLRDGVFEMYGGKIWDNCATFSGGGVFSIDSFSWSSGTISGNVALDYNDVYILSDGGSSDGNGSDSGDGGSLPDNPSLSLDGGFSFRDVAFVCVCVGVVVAVLFFVFKKELEFIRKKS